MRKKIKKINLPVFTFLLCFGVVLFAVAVAVSRNSGGVDLLAFLRDPTKTLEFFIVQDTVTPIGVPDWWGEVNKKQYNIFVSEYDAPNTAQVRYRDAYVKITGIAVSSGAFTIQVRVNTQPVELYNMPSTGGNSSFFTIIYKVTSLNYDYPGDTTAYNTLEINFPTPPTSVSLLSAKQVFTYSINAAI